MNPGNFCGDSGVQTTNFSVFLVANIFRKDSWLASFSFIYSNCWCISDIFSSYMVREVTNYDNCSLAPSMSYRSVKFSFCWANSACWRSRIFWWNSWLNWFEFTCAQVWSSFLRRFSRQNWHFISYFRHSLIRWYSSCPLVNSPSHIWGHAKWLALKCLPNSSMVNYCPCCLQLTFSFMSCRLQKRPAGLVFESHFVQVVLSPKQSAQNCCSQCWQISCCMGFTRCEYSVIDLSGHSISSSTLAWSSQASGIASYALTSASTCYYSIRLPMAS